jgi:GT2 family glycosyltransferase
VKLFIGIPSSGAPTKPFLESLASLALPPNDTAPERTVVTGNFVPAQRELIVERALAARADVLVMCDDDMVLPRNALVDLCSILERDSTVGLAGALYYSRDGLRPMTVEGWRGDDTSSGWIPAFDDATPVAVTGVGFGCVAIRTSAFSCIERPYFPAQIFIEHGDGRVRVCNEDYLFCERLAKIGMRTVLHPGVRCGHYDRVHDRVMPFAWESPEASNRRRVLVVNGANYELVPLEGAPGAAPLPQRNAAISYIDGP